MPFIYLCFFIYAENCSTAFTDGWEKKRNPYEKLDYGKWQLNLPANPDGTCPIQHGSKIKVALNPLEILSRRQCNQVVIIFFVRWLLKQKMGHCWIDCLHGQLMSFSPHPMRVVLTNKWFGIHSRYSQDNYIFEYAELLLPDLNNYQKYEFKHSRPKRPNSLRVYECHVGIATADEKVGSYKEFRENVIPRIVKLGITMIWKSVNEFHQHYLMSQQVTTLFN